MPREDFLSSLVVTVKLDGFGEICEQTLWPLGLTHTMFTISMFTDVLVSGLTGVGTSDL